MDSKFKSDVLAYIRSNYMGLPGRYRYSADCSVATLYSSCYAAMTKGLLGAELEDADEWADYICSHQEDDGLFKDPVIYGQGWYEGDPIWCGRTHLTSHVLIALMYLGRIAPKEIRFLDPWKDQDHLLHWLDGMLWSCDGDISTTGNEIMNIGGLLQYERDFHNDAKAGRSVETIIEWLNTHHLDPETGLWGDNVNWDDPKQLSCCVQAAYHWWELYFYDGIDIPYADKAVEYILRTQNRNGGFGLGVHNPLEPDNSSACEDIDSIAPLARLYRLGRVRNDEIKKALEDGIAWVKTNQVSDGGLVFMKSQPFEYGHPQLQSEANKGAMFPTWFRTLTIALAQSALGDDSPKFIRCPQMQFDV